MEINKANAAKILTNVCTVIGIMITLLFLIYGFKNRIFTSKDALSGYILGFGAFAPIIFILIQVIQVIIPILPGSIGCALGVIAFGSFWGFMYSYVGICLGSIIAFMLAKRYGLALVQIIVSKKIFKKYSNWLEKDNKFEKLFALAIFFPVAPDDMLCFLVGLTPMTLKKFTLIIFVCKPFSTFIYSMGLTAVLSALNSVFH